MRLLSIVPAALFGAAFTLGAVSIASAQYQQPPGYYQSHPRIHDIQWVKAGVGTVVLTLQEHRDYGGHRGAALNYLHYANRELRFAIDFAQAHGYQFNDLGAAHPYNEGEWRGSPDRPVFNAQRHVQVWIDMLQRDGRDYGGHRAAAIDNLQRAEGELTAALQAGE